MHNGFTEILVFKYAKFCDKLLKPITTNKYTVRDSFLFAKEVEEFDPNLVITTFDVKSLFPNIPLTETKHILMTIKNSFRRIFKMTMFESIFIFHQEYYKQCDGFAMGSPLGSTLTNVLMCHFEKICLEIVQLSLNLLCIEDMRTTHFYFFVQQNMQKTTQNIIFTSEIEQSASLSFLDVEICRENLKMSPQFTESLYLVELLPILKVLFPNHVNVV